MLTHPVQCSFQTNTVTFQQTEKFKYLVVRFSSGGKQDNKQHTRIGKASAIMHQLCRLIVLKLLLCTKAKFSVFRSVFVPILIYVYTYWIMTKRVKSRLQATEMGILQNVRGLSLLDKVKNTDICQFLNIEPLLLRIEQSQLRWSGHVKRISTNY